VTNGYLDDVEIRKVSGFEIAFLRFIKDTHPDLVQTVATGAKMDEETHKALGQAIEDFKATVAF
jgi:F-type H+-transporting ATPase subunit alpha